MIRDIATLNALPAAVVALAITPVAPACDDPVPDESDGPPAAEVEVEVEAAEVDDSAPHDGAPAELAHGRPATPAPDGFSVEVVTTGGKGCPDPQSVKVSLVGNDVLRLAYSKLALKTPPGAVVQSTFCTVGAELHIPPGWKVAPASVNGHGYADLESGVRGQYSSKLFFAGVPLSSTQQRNLVGDYQGHYIDKDVIPDASLVWSQCGASALLSITATLVLNTKDNPGSKNSLGLESLSVLSWKWQKC